MSNLIFHSSFDKIAAPPTIKPCDMKKIFFVSLIVIFTALVASYFALANSAYQGSAFAAKNLCSGIFISKMPAQTLIDQAITPASSVFSFLSYKVDKQNKTVQTRLFGLYKRSAQFRPQLGCTLLARGETSLPKNIFSGIKKPPLNNQNKIETVNTSEKLKQAVDLAFAENDSRGAKNTKALIVMHHGKIIAERYAKGVDATTPLLGWSMTKSISNMLIGILVRENKLDINQPAAIAEWANDERSSITVNNLLHMSSGLAFNEYNGLNTDVAQMLTQQSSAGHFAANKPLLHPPNQHWSYSSGSTNILARVIHEHLGGHLQHSQQFAYKELFEPLDIQNAYLEPDPSGVFIGSSFLYLTTRDWAKLGQLMLQDGVWRGQRLLPPGWVNYSVTPAKTNHLNKFGAHFWLNKNPNNPEKQRTWPDVPEDAYAMNGYQGQHVVIIPSKQLVIVRLGFTPRPARPGMNKLLNKIIQMVNS
ncbi:MAG: serine hydrolase [Spongiibacteraceae bacterium]|nr:serine hydrolase [Spongiibacteraceae bacterium]